MLVVGARVEGSWAEAAQLSVEETRLLLLLDSCGGESSASELASMSGMSVARVYPLLHRLSARGEVEDRHRRHVLTDRGTDSIVSLKDARRKGIADYLSGLDSQERDRMATALGLDKGR